VENVRRTLKNLVIGKEIKEVNVLYSKIINGDIDEFKDVIEGQKIVEISRVGKYLVFILEDAAFISHLRMEGKYRYLTNYNADKQCREVKEQESLNKNESLDKHDHLVFNFKDGSCLCYNDVRKFGRLELVDRDNYLKELPLSKLGPEPSITNVDQLYPKIHRSNLPIKAILLEQNIIAGIGNIYANEICFQMGINPYTIGSKLSKRRVEELIKVSREILEKSIALGGTTIHSFTNVGVSGQYQQELKVHGKKVCCNCDSQIIKEKIKGRGTYYCKKCQKS
jgi:formamidopyrimidine-DNA glycosylase